MLDFDKPIKKNYIDSLIDEVLAELEAGDDDTDDYLIESTNPNW